MRKTIRIATRGSPLALWQATYVKTQLEAIVQEVSCVLIPIKTSGDHFLQDSLATMGGKGLFVKELEYALLNDQADIAVHSMKDVPVHLPNGLAMGAYLERSDPRDAFISVTEKNLQALPMQARIGSASLRRTAILKHIRPDLMVTLLRGNVQTRLAQLEEKKYDAIILAAAGLKRLGLEQKIGMYFNTDEFIPAINQGILGIECRLDDDQILFLLKKINHVPTQKIAETERAFNRRLGGSCHVPIAGFATWQDQHIHLTGLVADLEGKIYLKSMLSGSSAHHEKIGIQLAEQLLAQGADKILEMFN